MRYNTETFIKDAALKHNNRYDYSKLEYSSKKLLEIICPDHGLFQRNAWVHLRGNRNKGSGCPKCGVESRRKKTIDRNISSGLTQNDFLLRAKEKHGNLYDYTLSVFRGIRHHVDIICSKHGVFSQMAQAHIINGQGCPVCFKEHRRSTLSKKSLNQKVIDFCSEASKVHSNKFDYSETDLTVRDEKGRVSVICPEHGKFYVRPAAHLRKNQGCPPCSFKSSAEKTADINRLNLEEFIEKANIIHGKKYDYSNTVYFRRKDKITISCRIHGNFKQTASDHLNGNGCQKCANFATSKMEQEWLDSLKVKMRRKLIKIANRRFYVDGYDPDTNTVYEFLGNYWHGNPLIYKSQDINKRCKKTFGELYQKTMDRLDLIRDAGYNVKIIWENEWTDENNIQTR